VEPTLQNDQAPREGWPTMAQDIQVSESALSDVQHRDGCILIWASVASICGHRDCLVGTLHSQVQGTTILKTECTFFIGMFLFLRSRLHRRDRKVLRVPRPHGLTRLPIRRPFMVLASWRNSRSTCLLRPPIFSFKLHEESR